MLSRQGIYGKEIMLLTELPQRLENKAPKTHKNQEKLVKAKIQQQGDCLGRPLRHRVCILLSYTALQIGFYNTPATKQET